jgi:hypothetical protein
MSRNLVHEERVGRQLEGLGAMRLQTEGPPDPMDRGGRVADRARHAAQGPMGCVRRRLFQRPADRLGDLVVADAPRRPRARLVVEPVEPTLREPATPFADRRRIRSQPRGDLLVLEALGRRQHDLSPSRQALRRAPPPAQTLQLPPLQIRQGNRHRRHTTSTRHRATSSTSHRFNIAIFSIGTLGSVQDACSRFLNAP